MTATGNVNFLAVQVFPFFAENNHHKKIQTISGDLTAFREPALFEALLGAYVPVQCRQIDFFQRNLVKDMFEKQVYGFRPVTPVPVVTIANHNPHFGFGFGFIDIVIDAIPDVLSVQGFHGEFMSSGYRVTQLKGEL